jgi:hypothetical protein
MRSKINYLFAILCAGMGLLMTYINLQRPEVGLFHWFAVGLMLVGAWYYYDKAEKLRS